MSHLAPKNLLADDPRNRLIEAGLDLFGMRSFEGAGTRLLAERAGVNLSAIKYYFGGKEGLYLAVAQHIAERMRALLSPSLSVIRDALRRDDLSRKESLELLEELLGSVLDRFLGDPETQKWLSVIVREQLSPTNAFDVLFDAFKPMDQALFELAARIMDAGPDDPDVRIRMFAVMGEILMFHVSPASVRRTLGWESYGPENLKAVRRIITENIRAIFGVV
jgi:AcrR family transcriptional regulator